MNNLNVGGAEKALVSLLQVFDYEKYNVDLLLFKKEGIFLKQVPQQVNILNEPTNYRYFDMPFIEVVKENFFNLKWNVIWQRIQFKRSSKKAENQAQAEQFGWKPLSETLKPMRKQYDVAIGFLEKNPNYFVIDKVHAKKKIGFIHNDYNQLGLDGKFDFPYVEKFDFVITVSTACFAVLQSIFPEYDDKFYVIYNIVSEDTIRELAFAHKVDVKDGFNIVSVGRLEKQKGYDLAYDAVTKIMRQYSNVHWYILGEGSQQIFLRDKIKTSDLEDRIFLVGAVENPYPYMLSASVFLHAANFEGDGIVVREAKILGKAIVLTNFNTASQHIEDGITGLIVDFSSKKIADALDKLHNNPDVGSTFSENLSKESWSIEHEIEKLYQLIES